MSTKQRLCPVCGRINPYAKLRMDAGGVQTYDCGTSVVDHVARPSERCSTSVRNHEEMVELRAKIEATKTN